MPFKKTQPPLPVPASPDQLLRTFSRRKIPDVLPHQQQLLQSYVEVASKSDIALQLPTGSGKTLVGLLAAEWIRRKHHERVVYLCPTRQLVHQVVDLSENTYGLHVVGFVGSQHDYDPVPKAEYRNADAVAVTTYSSVFNSNPFFHDASVLIIDDAHAAESYIADVWSVRLTASNENQVNARKALFGLLRPHLDSTTFARLTGQWSGVDNYDWVDMLPVPTFFRLRGEITEILDEHAESAGAEYSWARLRDHLHTCNMYFSTGEMLIRPLIAPTWTHAPFTEPRQRIYMSATLGRGGELERTMGRTPIHRLPISDEWTRQGVGRRLFLFPSMSLTPEEIEPLTDRMMRKAGRSLVLVPSDKDANELVGHMSNDLGMSTFRAKDLETSKTPFTTTADAVAVIANRYDGLDFSGDECRLEFVAGLPQATNLQERYLMSRMGANVLYNERVWTRVLQSIGRCTRSMQDYAAVVLTDERVVNYLADPQRRPYFHPELQAEIEFGVTQSRAATASDFMEYLTTFLDNGQAWEVQGNREILALTAQMEQKESEVLKHLEAVVADEIAFVKALWQANFPLALDRATHVLGSLEDPSVRGYRALWNYLCGSTALLNGSSTQAREYFSAATNGAAGLHVVSPVHESANHDIRTMDPSDESILWEQIENLEAILERLGTTHDRKFSAYERAILEGLASSTFEQAQVQLGTLLGFRAKKVESDGSPDPWWAVGNLCLVFEDHANASADAVIGAEKARQAKGHPDWLRANAPEVAHCNIWPILVTPATKMMSGASPHLDAVSLWPLDEFRQWGEAAVSVIRTIRRTFREPGDVDWRENAKNHLIENGLDAVSLYHGLQERIAANQLVTAG